MVIGILLAACSLEAAGRYYADLLPDTLQPGNSYAPHTFYPVLAKTAAGEPGRWPDTVDLKRGTTVMRMIGQLGPGDGSTYPLQVPANAVIGSYGAYSPQGALLEADVALVPDIRSVDPHLLVAPGQRGVRSGTYRISVTSNGLAFGPLPASGAYATTVTYAALEMGTDTLRLQTLVSATPYALSGSITVPWTAAEGKYRLVVARGDGLRLTAEDAFEVWVPAKPQVQAVAPDTLPVGETTTLGITGLDLAYATVQACFVSLDRALVKEVHLRNADGVLPASRYPDQSLGTWYVSGQSTIKAAFDIPVLFPQGDYDVGIIIAGRPDTVYWDGKVHVVGATPARWISFVPQLPWRSQFLANAEGQNLPGDPVLAAYTLRRGGSVIAGTYKSMSKTALGENIFLSFNPDSTSDTGWYDFQADFAGMPPVRFEHAVRLAGPTLDPLQRTVWNQGQADSLWVSVTGVEFPWVRADASPKAENLERFSLCRESRCLDIVANEPQFSGWNIFLSIPSDWPPGMYDAIALTRDPARRLVQPNAALIVPAGYRGYPLNAYLNSVPYWSARMGRPIQIGIRPGDNCPSGGYRIEAGPTGAAVSPQNILMWTPTAQDTGMHLVRLAGTGGCNEKVFLAISVGDSASVAIGPKRQGSRDEPLARIYRRGNRFELDLRESGQAELRTLSGRWVADLGRLDAGAHGFVPPASARGDALLLCHLRTASGDAWLKVPRLP